MTQVVSNALGAYRRVLECWSRTYLVVVVCAWAPSKSNAIRGDFNLIPTSLTYVRGQRSALAQRLDAVHHLQIFDKRTFSNSRAFCEPWLSNLPLDMRYKADSRIRSSAFPELGCGRFAMRQTYFTQNFHYGRVISIERRPLRLRYHL